MTQMLIETQKIKLFDVLGDMRKVSPVYADGLGSDFDDDTLFIRKAASSETIDVQPAEGIIIGRINTLAIDTYDEVILPEGMDKRRYDKNRVVLWGHNYQDHLPHGENAWITPYPKRDNPTEVRVATKYYVDTERGAEVYKHRAMKRPLGYSIGFIPTKDIVSGDDDWEEVFDGWAKRYIAYSGNGMKMKDVPVPQLICLKWILLEYSDVVVPANPDTVAMYVTKGFISEDEKDEYTLPDPDTTDYEPIAKDIVLRPYPNEHACRLNDPDKYDEFARKKCAQKHDGKCIDVVYGIKAGKSEIQAYRYPKESWSVDAAKSHCEEYDGTFEAASENSLDTGILAQAVIDEIRASVDFADLVHSIIHPGPATTDLHQIKEKVTAAIGQAVGIENIQESLGLITKEPTALQEFSIPKIIARAQGTLE